MELVQTLRNFFQNYPAIKLAYLFGSVAEGRTDARSDLDLAVYCDSYDRTYLTDLQMELVGKLGLLLKRDDIDVVILNLVSSPLLKYNIIRSGVKIIDDEYHRTQMEPRILNEYFDFKLFKQSNAKS